MKQRGQRGMGRLYRRNEIWWVQWSTNGQRHRESSNSSDKAVAVRLLKKRLHEAQVGKPMGVAGTTFTDLMAILLNNYHANGRRSGERAHIALNRLKEFFGEGCKASDLTADRIVAYQAHRLEQNISAGTVNYELAMLRHAFRLGVDADKVPTVPRIKMLTLHNVRQGFFEREQYEAVLRHLPDYARPVIQVAFFTGWRVRSELLTRQWRHIDLDAGWLRLEPNESKNGEGRVYPLTGELLGLLQAQREHVSRIERALGRVIPSVFVHDDGRPISDLRYAWKRACYLAGVPNKLVHDLRRTSVRNMERAGVPRSAAMKLSGHLTESIYRRYAITDPAMLREGAAKLAALYRQEKIIPTATQEGTNFQEPQ